MIIKNEYNDSNKNQISNDINDFLSFFMIYKVFTELQYYP